VPVFFFSQFRTKPTLSGKQKRQLQEKLEYVQEVVKTKKVKCAFVLLMHLKMATVGTDSSNDLLVCFCRKIFMRSTCVRVWVIRI